MDTEMLISLWFICDSNYIISLELFAALLPCMTHSFFEFFCSMKDESDAEDRSSDTGELPPPNTKIPKFPTTARKAFT